MCILGYILTFYINNNDVQIKVYLLSILHQNKKNVNLKKKSFKNLKYLKKQSVGKFIFVVIFELYSYVHI